ncbi:hypothetical protein, partial [Vibrio mediterranei]|uniref:hypothetical protein n=1 Tax=Vibrio mediterranei TaxID=689 RepID=UPI00148E6DC9
LEGGYYYIVAEGGVRNGDSIKEYKAMAALNAEQSGSVVVNELTTIGSVWPLAPQMSASGDIIGAKNGLLLGFSHVQNLVDVETGDYGATVLDGANLTFSETVGRMNVLASLMASCGGYQKQDTCTKFLEIVDAPDTLAAMRQIATKPYEHPEALFNLFKTDFPYAKGEGVRPTSFLPYLEWAPKDFALMVRFTGGGVYSPGRMMFDNRGQLWSGQNWMPGNQANLSSAIGGGVSRLDASGKAISPRLTGYNRQGLDGIGWGTTVSEDKVWVSSFNAKVGVLDLDGNALGPATVNGKYGALQGLATAPNGDVWIADNQYNQVLRFPKGDFTKGEVVKVPGLKRPFAIAVDNTNHVWVTNNGYVTVTRFPADAPEQAQQIQLGAMAPRGIAIDSTGHVWVGNNFSMGYPLAKIPEGASIIDEFKLNIEKILENEKKGITKSGNLTLIGPNGKVIKKEVLNGTANLMWGVSIDGDDNVYAGNFLGTGFVQVCGTDTSKCPDGKTTGDLIHLYQSGVLQESTDIMIDDAGNAWMANNWDFIPALVDANPDRRTATRGGGTGMVVIYGIAAPVKNPLIGQVRKP